jgi:F-type H+-transporting ATPase subunit b
MEREAETERLLSEAADEAERIRADRKDLEANWEEMISEARREAAERRRELLEAARSQVEVREAQWMESLRDSQDRLLDQLQRETGERAIEITRNAVRDLADTDLEGSIVDVFIERLSDLEASDMSEVLIALRTDDRDPIEVRTSFALSESQRDAVRSALQRLLADPAREIEWIRDPDLVAGVVVVVGARTIGWTIDTYLAAVRAGFAEILRHQVEEAHSVTEASRVP